MPQLSSPANRASSHRSGFTLIETLTVLAIMVVLAALSVPAINGIRSTYNRQQATTTVVSAVERARVAAVQSGGNVYVVFALSTDSGVTPDQVIVAGDPPLGTTNGSEVLYTKWIKLPQNIRFRSSPSTLPTNTIPTSVTSSLPAIGGNPIYSGFYFNPAGQIASPASGGLVMAFFEGIRQGSTSGELAEGASALATLNLSDSGLYDLIRLSRYDGRSWQEVGTLQTK